MLNAVLSLDTLFGLLPERVKFFLKKIAHAAFPCMAGEQKTKLVLSVAGKDARLNAYFVSTFGSGVRVS